MNIVKLLEKQVENGKNVITADGTIVSDEGVRKVMMKDYLAGIKAGTISTDKSFEMYVTEASYDNLAVQDVIDFIKNPVEQE